MAEKPYEIDGDGRIMTTCGAVLVAKESTDPDAAVERNMHGRVFIEHGAPWTNVFECGGKRYIIATGVGVAKPGTMSSVFHRIRAEASSTIPLDPEAP